MQWNVAFPRFDAFYMYGLLLPPLLPLLLLKLYCAELYPEYTSGGLDKLLLRGTVPTCLPLAELRGDGDASRRSVDRECDTRLHVEATATFASLARISLY
jgi:hypothetical protein